MKALIDGDIILHSCSQGRDDEEEYYVLGAAKRMTQNILDAMEATKYDLILSGSWETNFRYQVYPEYKSNRKPERPRHFDALRKYMLGTWNGRVVEGEADDELGILGYQSYEQDVRDAGFNNVDVKDESTCSICTIDKDLNMIPGWHLNWKREDIFWVSNRQAWYNFFVQLLTGDSVDCIPGIKGVGPRTAERILGTGGRPEYLAEVVSDEYQARLGEDWEDYMYTMADLIWITRERGVTGSQVLRRLL